MKEPLFTGVCTALVTPFLNGNVNYPMFEQLLRRQMEAGIPAVVVCGTTGESPTLTDSEKINLFRCAVDYAGGNMKIIAGTGSNDTQHTLELSRMAEDTGVDGLLVVSPYYNKPTPSGLIAHYETLADSISLPIILYNVPGRTGVDLPVSVYRKLCRHPNIAGVKEASSDIIKITKIAAACGRKLPIWTGNDEMITPAISLGATGVISVLSNLLPEATKTMTDAALNGDFTTSAAFQVELQEVIELLFSESNPIPIKEAMRLMGYDCGDCRLPLTGMSPEKRKKLKELLQ